MAIRGSLHAVKGEKSLSVQNQGVALRLLRKGSNGYFCALRNLGDSLLELHDLAAINEVLKLLNEARVAVRSDLSRSKRRAPDAFLNWVEGRINGKLGSHRNAIRLLNKAKTAFFELGGDYVRDALLVSVDLGIVFESGGDFYRALIEAKEALQVAQAFRLASEAAVLQLFLSEKKDLIDLRDDLRGAAQRLEE